jgi:hypothetical protein
MGSKKKRKRRGTRKTPSEFTDMELEALQYLTWQQLEQMEQEGQPVGDWTTTFKVRCADATPAVKKLAAEFGKILSEKSARGPGRPPEKAAEKRLHPDSYKVAVAVRDYTFQNPGAMVIKGERHRYSDGFRTFVLSLLKDDGLARNLTLGEAADATSIPYNTLTHWLSEARRRK